MTKYVLMVLLAFLPGLSLAASPEAGLISEARLSKDIDWQHLQNLPELKGIQAVKSDKDPNSLEYRSAIRFSDVPWDLTTDIANGANRITLSTEQKSIGCDKVYPALVSALGRGRRNENNIVISESSYLVVEEYRWSYGNTDIGLLCLGVSKINGLSNTVQPYIQLQPAGSKPFEENIELICYYNNEEKNAPMTAMINVNPIMKTVRNQNGVPIDQKISINRAEIRYLVKDSTVIINRINGESNIYATIGGRDTLLMSGSCEKSDGLKPKF